MSISEKEYFFDEKEPTRTLDKDQINAIDDHDYLLEYIDDLKANIIEIENNLKYSNRDDEWRGRAIGALTHFHIAKDRCERRLEKLYPKPSKIQENINHQDSLTRARNAEAERLRQLNVALELAGKLVDKLK